MDDPNNTPLLRRRRKSRGGWLAALLATVTVAGLIIGIMWLAGFRRPEWSRVLGSFTTSDKAKSQPQVGGLGTRDRADLGLTWLGNGKAKFGAFTVLAYDPVTRTHVLSEFRLEGETDCKSEAAFHEYLDGYRRFLREQVAVTIRSCSQDELSREKLPLLQKKIASQVNRALGREFLTNCKIEEFAVYESVDHGRFLPVEEE